MKRKLMVLIVLCVILLSFAGCKETNYEEAVIPEDESFVCSEYFTLVKQWGTNLSNYKIVYANDTNVMYFIMRSEYMSGITPLYNSDGTLQVYCSE